MPWHEGLPSGDLWLLPHQMGLCPAEGPGLLGRGRQYSAGSLLQTDPGVFSQTPSPQSKLQVRAAAGLPGRLLRPQTWLQASQTGGCADSSPCSCPHHTHTQLGWTLALGGHPSLPAQQCLLQTLGGRLRAMRPLYPKSKCLHDFK